MNTPSIDGISSRAGCSFAHAIKLVSSEPLGGRGDGRQNSLRAPLWDSFASSTMTAPSTKPWQKLTAAVILGSSSPAEQIAIRSRTVFGGNCDSVTAAGAGVGVAKTTPAASNAAPKYRHFDLIRIPPSLPAIAILGC